MFRIYVEKDTNKVLASAQGNSEIEPIFEDSIIYEVKSIPHIEQRDLHNAYMYFDGNEFSFQYRVNVNACHARINNLEAEIRSTDYKIVKAAEYNLVGKKLEFDIKELHSARQQIRDRINELRALIGE